VPDRVVAKFTCLNRTDHGYFDTAAQKPAVGNVGVQLTPVASQDPRSENGQFWQATPSGQIQMSISNPAAFAFFEPGAEYYVTFERAGLPDA